MALQQKHEYIIKYFNNRFQYDATFKSAFPNISDTIEQTLTIEESYFMIRNVDGDKDIVKIIVDIYKDSTKNVLIDTRNYKFKPDLSDNALNFIKQGYLYLKTLPEYADAIDC